jgi:hypothetical protein
MLSAIHRNFWPKPSKAITTRLFLPNKGKLMAVYMAI